MKSKVFILKILVVYAIIFALTSIGCLWLINTKSEPNIFAQSPFIFTAEKDKEYTLSLGTTNGHQPKPEFSAITVSAVRTIGGTNSELKLERVDAGYEFEFKTLKAVSLAKLPPKISGPVKVSVTGWAGSGRVFIIDHEFVQFALAIAGILILHVILTVIFIRKLVKRNAL